MARAVSAEMHSGFVRLRSDCPMDLCVCTPMTGISEALAADIARIDALWTECRSRFGRGGPFLFGGFTIADAMFAPVVSRFTTYALPMGPQSRVYADAVSMWPAFVAWREKACA
jgi:glutathione S-transferase